MRLRTAALADAPAVARVHVASWHVAYRGIMPDDVIARTTLSSRTGWWSAEIERREWPVFVVEQPYGRRAGWPYLRRAVWPYGRRAEIVGFCHVTASRDPDADPRTVAEIPSLHVLPHLRGRGLGRALLDRALAELRRRGYAECTLWVLEENRPAQAFYEKLGWRPDGGRMRYGGTDVPEVRYRMAISR
ncbi:MAG: GNAT family N-acetyltransferase [Gemmatimonadales bacterium]